MQKDARHEAIVRMLLDRQVEDRDAREKRLRGYPPCSESTSTSSSPVRLHRFATKVPCRVSPSARALLNRLRKQCAGSTVSFPLDDSGAHAIMVSAAPGAKPRQIGWLDQFAQTDVQPGTEFDQGLVVETDGAGMLVLQFCYPQTPVKMSFAETAPSHFTEIRFALDQSAQRAASSPSLVWVTRPEVDAIDDVGFRDFETFYVRFKHEIQAAIWSTLSLLLLSAPHGEWRDGAYYTVTREPDATNGRIVQRTTDDHGGIVDIGLNRIYDTPAATNILLLYLEADILADVADIYFTLCSLHSTEAASLREEFYASIRRFWESTASLTYRYGNETAAVQCICQRAVPTPVQAQLLRQDWTLLRQHLIDQFGEAGRNAPHVVAEPDASANDAVWPFAAVAPGDVNLGLRVVYNQSATYGAHVVERPLGNMGPEISPVPAEIQNVVLIAEELPSPADIDVTWVKKHDWILAKVLLDESFRDTLMNITREASTSLELCSEFEGTRDETIEHVRIFSGTTIARADGIEMEGEWKRGYRYTTSQQLQRLPSAVELVSMRQRLCDHIKANILHYQQAIWAQEDPQQKCMRYRKSDSKVSLDWRFELECSAALTIDELCDHLMAPTIDGQFATYSTGRTAGMDQVINVAEPLGYYGNYAIYPMHPEFAGEDLFSMLHFFKAPYLHIVPQPVIVEAEEVEPALCAVSLAEIVEEPEVYPFVLEDTPDMFVITTGPQHAGEWAIAVGEGEPAADLSIRVAPASEPLIVGVQGTLIASAGGKFGRIEHNTTLVIGAPAARVQQPVIVATGLWAGRAAVRRYELASARLIVAREDGRLRPSLIAG